MGIPRPTDPTKHVNNSSYRVKLRNFHYKMGLTTREHIRGTGQRKVYKYTNHLTLKHLRKHLLHTMEEIRGWKLHQSECVIAPWK